MLEKEFYKLVTPEGKQNYILEGQAKLLLLLCQEIDKLNAAKQGVQSDGSYEWVCKECQHKNHGGKLCEVCLANRR